jgi:hypothetical protein
MTNEKIVGLYVPTDKAIEKLERHYSETDISKIRKSSIVIYADGDSIMTVDMPVTSMDSAYFLCTSTDKLYIKKGHEKFWHLRRRQDYFPDIKFRLKDGIPSLLVNLGVDPDYLDYHEYRILQE